MFILLKNREKNRTCQSVVKYLPKCSKIKIGLAKV